MRISAFSTSIRRWQRSRISEKIGERRARPSLPSFGARKNMSGMRWVGLAGGLLCAFITPADAYAAETRGAVPNFSSGDFPWVPLSPEYVPPASGPGPVTYDHA